MLTAKQNLLETIRGGTPDRFVNQFEPFGLLWMVDPLNQMFPLPLPGEENVNGWGVTHRFTPNTPSAMPLHGDGYTVLEDITTWQEVVKAPSLDFPEKAWAASEMYLSLIDRNERFVTLAILPGVFEMLHYLMGMENCMISLITHPDEIKALINYYVDWEIAYAKILIDRLDPDALFHHDDWGSSESTFMSKGMFEEFFVPAYKKLYGFYKDNGIQLIIHHSDSYAATLVPCMIEMGIDIWQGCMSTNNTPQLIQQYGGQISFMGDIDNLKVDKADWKREQIRSEVERACKSCGKLYFIPDLIIGGPGSVFPGVYDAVGDEIDRVNKELF
jgi:hypothetical protein